MPFHKSNPIISFSYEASEIVNGLIFGPVTFSVPIKRGILPSDADLKMIDIEDEKQIVNSYVSQNTAIDGITWINVRCDETVCSSKNRLFGILVDESDKQKTDSKKYSALSVLLKATDIHPYIVDAQGDVQTLENTLPTNEKCLNNDPHTSIGIYGQIKTTQTYRSREGLLINLEFTEWSRSPVIGIEYKIHNPKAACHKNGLWDLGDPNSEYVKEAGVFIRHSEGINYEWFDASTSDSHIILEKPFDAVQFDEGNQNTLNFFSDNRREVTKKLSQGFELLEGSELLISRDRPDSISTVIFNNGYLSVNVNKFWQESPTAIRFGTCASRIALIGIEEGETQEIQPGEWKRRKINILYSDSRDKVSVRKTHDTVPNWGIPVSVSVIAGDNIADIHCGRAVTLDDPFDEAIAKLLEPPREFLVKREAGREFGWRNYGEVFADHESIYRIEGKTAFVSHYNNQYDMIFGFAMQYLRTGDQLWFEVFNDLARHVVDIDIYHTTDDRTEYNNGLFWHTNHYEDAATATHRTFSVANYDTNGRFGSSGGPSAEHCYTTGLMMHYRLTGDVYSKNAILDLTSWIVASFAGDSCLLGRLKSIASNELPILLRRLAGKEDGAFDHFEYPLTRGTGNLVTALLDSFQVEDGRQWLEKAETVICSTFCEADDIEARSLLEAEKRWSYTIFLQAILRYLQIKISLSENDECFQTIHRAYVAYIFWMSEYEVPYLHRPDTLEFPNSTWAAQEIRKCVLLQSGLIFDSERASHYFETLTTIQQHLVQTLNSNSERKLTRLQAILMQNVGYASALRKMEPISIAKSLKIYPPARKKPLADSFKKLKIGLKEFNLQSEIKWLSQRK